MIEKEIERQVAVFVNTKMKELTMKKLSNMGYDLKNLAEKCMYEEIQTKLNIKELYEKIEKEDGLKLVAKCLAEEMVDTIKYSRDY